MTLVSHGSRVAVRSYSDDMAVLCRRDGARLCVTSPTSTVIRRILEHATVDSLLTMCDLDAPVGSSESLALSFLRTAFKHLFALPGRTALADLYRTSPYLAQVAMAIRVPLTGMCEITFRCNLRCVHCFVLHRVEEPRPAQLALDKIEEILSALYALGGLDVCITGGEPTLHKNFLHIVTLAKSLFLYTTVKTNASTFNSERAEAFANDPPHETHVSLYGARSNTHDSFTQTAGSYRRTIDGLRELSRVGIRSKINVTVWRGNADELHDMTVIASDLGHDIVFDDVIHGRLNGDRSPVLLGISTEQHKRLQDSGVLREFRPSPCSAGMLKLKIAADGRASACEFFDGGLGDVHQSDLPALWRSRYAAEAANQIIQLSKIRKEDGTIERRCPGLQQLESTATCSSIDSSPRVHNLVK